MGRPIINLQNRTFERLTAIEKVFDKTQYKWKCLCSCGNIVIVVSNKLTSGHTKSCGCLAKEILLKRNTKHNLVRTKEYKCWQKLKERCYNPNCKEYKNYGGRGINVCKEWINSFQCFINDMGNKYSEKHSIDRINVNGNYCKENCRWATSKEQSNNRRNNVIFIYNGISKTQNQWAEFYNISSSTFINRIKRMTFEELANFK